MKTENKIMLTGKQYQQIKEKLETQPSYKYNTGTDSAPEIVQITDIYLDTDPEFTRNYNQYAKVGDDNFVQVKIEYDGAW